MMLSIKPLLDDIHMSCLLCHVCIHYNAFCIAVSCFQITEACSACFEQRTVFTPQVLAKALNQMVCESCPFMVLKIDIFCW